MGYRLGTDSPSVLSTSLGERFLRSQNQASHFERIQGRCSEQVKYLAEVYLTMSQYEQKVQGRNYPRPNPGLCTAITKAEPRSMKANTIATTVAITITTITIMITIIVTTTISLLVYYSLYSLVRRILQADVA